MKIDPYCVRCNPTGLFGTYEYYTGADCGSHDDDEQPIKGFCAWCNEEALLTEDDLCTDCAAAGITCR